MKEKVTFNINKKENFSEWFSEIVKEAELADLRYNVKGFVVFRPWAVMVMEKMYDLFEKELQKKGHLPSWFPAVIPEENFKKEAQHVKGFIPQVFWITEASDTKLEQRLALRPTSETAIFPMYSLWIRSHKDLPLKIYQRAQVWRYETNATRPLIRSREFYWIEAHDCFSTKEGAESQVLEDISTTEEIMHKKLGIPFLPLKRPQWDKFPGAIYTIGSDSLMPDGKVIQQPSTHLLEQDFAKNFDIKFKDKDGKDKYIWQTCYGISISRIFASLIAIHGDNNGIIFPFEVAPIQVVIIPINFEKDKKILKKTQEIKKQLSIKYRVKIDDSDKSIGEKFYFWEMKGIPIRLEIGPKELKKNSIILFRRDNKNKKLIKIKLLEKEIEKNEIDLTKKLIEKADKEFKNNIIYIKNKDELKKIENKIARVNFCSIDKDGEKCAEIIEKQFLSTVRGIRQDIKEKPTGPCIICGKKANVVTYIAKSY